MSDNTIVKISISKERRIYINTYIKNILVVIILLLSFTMAVQTSFSATETVTNTHYRLDTGVVFAWKNSAGVWQNSGIKPGAAYTYTVSFDVGSSYSNVDLYTYDGSNFDFQNDYYHWNRTAYASNQGTYNDNYFSFAASPLSVSGANTYNSSTGKMNVTYTAALNDGLNVKTMLSNQGKQYIYNLLDNPSDEIVNAMNLMDPHSESYNSNVEGYMYFLSIIIQYDVTETVIIPDPPIVTEPAITTEPAIEPDPDPDPEEPEEPQDNRAVEGTALLSLPKTSYVGHSVQASDESVFTVDGNPYSASHTYTENLASNSFKLVQSDGASIHRLTQISAELTFTSAGYYNVQLTVTLRDGTVLTDIKQIHVLDVPEISATLNGAQKENRKQVLNIQVAQNPAAPVTELNVELINLENSKSVTVSHNELTGGTNSGCTDEEALIYTRPVSAEGVGNSYSADNCYLICELPFLTKNITAQSFAYEVTCTASDGRTDSLYSEFSVIPDEAPAASIKIEKSYLRNKGSNTADITVESSSRTDDGDYAVCSWSIDIGDGVFRPADEIEGFRDKSFGQMQKVAFTKTGVGLFNVRLDVRDAWSDETLEEFISTSDYKTGHASEVSEVVNTAPIITAGVYSPAEADIMILAGSRNDYDYFSSRCDTLKRGLIEKGIYADITVEKYEPDISDADGDILDTLISVDTPFGFEGAWTFFENSNYYADNDTLYKIDATWNGGGANIYPQSPYSISAWDIETGERKWIYSFDDNVIPVDYTSKTTFLCGDDMGEYLFFTNGSKTLIMESDSGVPLTVIQGVIGKDSYISGENIFTVKTDGIYCIESDTDTLTKVLSAKMTGKSRRINGKIESIIVKNDKLFRHSFDMKKLSVENELLADNLNITSSTTIESEIDTVGGVIAIENNKTKNPKVMFFDGNNKSIKNVSFSKSYRINVTPIYNTSGEITYFANSFQYSGSPYVSEVSVYDIYSSYSATLSSSGTSYYSTETDRVVFAMELDGYVYVVTGAEYVYVYNEGYSPYPQRTINFKFSPSTGENRIISGFGFATGFGGTVEYGIRNDVCAAVQTADNNQNSGGIDGNITHILRWNQSLSKITSRYFRKHLDRENRENRPQAVLMTGIGTDCTDSEAALTSTAELLNSAQCMFYYSGVNISEGGNSGQQDSGGTDTGTGTGTDGNAASILSAATGGSYLDSNDIIRQLADVFSRNIGYNTTSSSITLEDPSVRLISGSSEGRIYSDVQLAPGKTYYYEYLTKSDAVDKDILSVSHETSSSCEGNSTDVEYVVTHVEEENFNSDQLNDYFSFDNSKASEGVYKAIYIKSESKSNHFYQSSHSFSFTVPEGKMAVLSFDYSMDNCDYGTSYPSSNYIKIDGAYWDQYSYWKASGHYHHKSLLSSGSHSIFSYAGFYGSSPCCALIYLDNIKVEYVSDNPDDNNLMKNTSSVMKEGSWNRVKGEFSAPYNAMSYCGYNAEVISGAPANCRYITTSDDGSYKSLSIAVPTDSVSVFTSIGIRASQPYAYSANNKRTVCFTWKDYTWTCFPNSMEDPAQVLCYTGSNCNLAYPVYLSGNSTISARYYNAKRYITAADYTLVRMLIVQNINDVVKNERFSCDWAKGVMLAEDQKYTGKSEISFNLSENQGANIKDFQIYYVENGEKVYISGSPFNDSESFSDWNADGIELSVTKETYNPEQNTKLIFKKGEYVFIKINYSDYEDDPELNDKYYYIYTHYPQTDDVHPESGQVLNEQINRFYNDGKYVLQIWTFDDTMRGTAVGGNPAYDKKSNVAEVVFYIESGGMTDPWIKEIHAEPDVIRSGSLFNISVTYDDEDKDILMLTTEIYADGECIAGPFESTGLTVDESGSYPPVVINDIKAKAAGIYTVVCVVSDGEGSGYGEYSFHVLPEEKILGSVFHTETWNDNRMRFNIYWHGGVFNERILMTEYLRESIPRIRGINVFWPGEMFMLSADVSGDSSLVSVEIEGYPEYYTELSPDEEQASGTVSVFYGSLWDESMNDMWGLGEPEELTFLFTSYFDSGNTKEYRETVIVDGMQAYYNLHGVF